MTPQEREKEKQLIREAKNRSESEEDFFLRSEGAPGKQKNSKGTQTTNSEGGKRRGGGRISNNNRKTKNVNSVIKEVMKINKLYLMMTNADVLTKDKIVELENRIQDENRHVIMISEVKPKNFKRTLSPIEYKVEGYELMHNNIEESRGRGMCTYVNNKLDYNEIKLKTNFNEYIAIDVKLNDNENMLLVNIYRSGSSGEDNSKELNKMLKEISNLKYHHTVIGGDVNYKDIDWQHNLCVSSATSGDFLFLEAVRDAYLTQHIEVPTRGRGSDRPTTFLSRMMMPWSTTSLLVRQSAKVTTLSYQLK